MTRLPAACRNTSVRRTACDDPGRTLGADTGRLTQAVRLLLDEIEHRLAETLHQPLGVDRTDACCWFARSCRQGLGSEAIRGDSANGSKDRPGAPARGHDIERAR
jgi:hypothetical protein